MAKGAVYTILGRGRWAERMQSILTGENRRVANIRETRQRPGESAAAYRSRLAEIMRTSGAHLAWLCILPGPHVAIMIEAALDAGLHVVVEKPWHGSPQTTKSLVDRAKSLRRFIAVHYEYCFLSEVEKWRREFGGDSGIHFSGAFFVSRRNHTGMHALDNLGSHLLAIRAYATPQSGVREIRCGYEEPDERRVWIEKAGSTVASINLLENKEPIIQRFIAKAEDSLDSAEFPIDLEFALRVANDVAALHDRSRHLPV